MLLPRSDLNVAMRAFSETVRIRPSFELGYGQLFKIPRMLERTLNGGVCYVFVETRDQVLSPGRSRTPSGGGSTFCPVVQDSLVWMRWAELRAVDKVGFREGADRVFNRSVDAFVYWAEVFPGQPRAFEKLSEALLLERTRMDIVAPERLQRMADEALHYASSAAELYADTTSEQLVQLANVHLVAGEGDVAVRLASQAVDRYTAPGQPGLSSAPGSLMNVLVVSGQTTHALAIGSGLQEVRSIRGPGNGPLISFAEAGPILERIRVLGAVGVHGPVLRAELDSLASTWRIAGHSNEEQQLLHDWVTLRDGVAASLVADSAALADWGESVTVEDPLWNALRLSYNDRVRATELYADAFDQGGGGVSRSIRAFILGNVSGRLGLDAAAIRHYSKLDSLPYLVDRFDSGWGLQVLSQLLRAEHYERLGDYGAALKHFRIFEDARAWPDALSRPGLQQAGRGIERVRSKMNADP